MAFKIRRILVGVRDLGHPPRNELRKAADIARVSGARLELFHAVDPPIHAGSLAGRAGAAARTQSTYQSLQHSRERLERYAQLACFQGLKLDCVSKCDYPPHEALVRQATASRADLVIAASHSHGRMRRLLLRNTDWELIRQCPCPLLLVKSPRPYSRGPVLAAIDPFHAHAKPAGLDARLLEVGSEWARLFGSVLHVFHAYLPLTSISPMPSGPAVPLAPPPEIEDAHGEVVAREFDRLAQRAGVPPAARHLRMGDTSVELCSAVRRMKAGVLVMGAVSRSGLRRIFIGNTAEKVLDEITTDVLIVKPRRFRSAVPAKALGTRSLKARSSS